MLMHRPFWTRFLCLLPFLASTLIPIGMMPVMSGDGTLTIVICTVHGPQERTVPLPGGEQPEGVSTWCPYSLLSAPALPAGPVHVVGIDHHETATLAIVTDGVPTRADIATGKPRAPPTIL